MRCALHTERLRLRLDARTYRPLTPTHTLYGRLPKLLEELSAHSSLHFSSVQRDPSLTSPSGLSPNSLSLSLPSHSSFPVGFAASLFSSSPSCSLFFSLSLSLSLAQTLFAFFLSIVLARYHSSRLFAHTTKTDVLCSVVLNEKKRQGKRYAVQPGTPAKFRYIFFLSLWLPPFVASRLVLPFSFSLSLLLCVRVPSVVAALRA